MSEYGSEEERWEDLREPRLGRTQGEDLWGAGSR